MTKAEAIALMRKGKKVRHRLFLPNEWIKLAGEMIAMEDGLWIGWWTFWIDRQGTIWDIDWEEVHE